MSAWTLPCQLPITPRAARAGTIFMIQHNPEMPDFRVRDAAVPPDISGGSALTP